MKRPILIVLIGYIIGIIWELYLNISIAPLFLIGTFLFVHLKNEQKSASQMLIILLISMLISNQITIYLNNRYENFYKGIGNESTFIGVVISDANKKEYTTSYTIKIKSVNGDTRFKNTKLFFNISNKREIELQYGDEIEFVGNYKEPEKQRNYKGYDYSMYLKTLEIYGTVNYSKINNIEHKTLNKINIFFHDITNNIEENIRKLLSEDEADLLVGILLGKATDMDEDIKDNFRNSGLYHILAVSGTHVVYIIIGIAYIVDKTHISARGKKILKIYGIICFALIVNNTVSVIRASLMALIAIGAELFFRRKDTICSIAISMLIILACNPFNIISISFQLSYMGVIGIVGLNKTYLKLLTKIKLKENLAKTISVILSAQTAIIPIMIMNYHTMSLTFLLANLLATHVTGAIIILGFIFVIISFFSLHIAKVFSVVLSILINFLNLIAKICGEIPFSKIFVTTPSLIVIILYYILLIYISRGTGHRAREIINTAIAFINMKNRKMGTVHRAPTVNYLFILVIVLIITIVLGTYNYIPKGLHIYFIDVGQGDSTLIITPSNKKILIDGGGTEVASSSYDVGEDTLVPYLLDRQINKLDFIMISHFDTDHSGGLIAVLESIKVKNIIISRQVETSNNFTTIINIAKNKNIKVIVVKRGDVIKVDKYVEITILYPESKLYFDDLNNNSIVAKIVYNNFSMLFTGDIESKAEERVIELAKSNLQATILKVAHHGSITSSTEQFLKYVKPKIALIGVGKNNKFGHPNSEVIKRFKGLRYKNL